MSRTWLADLLAFIAMVFVPTAIGLVSQWWEIARGQDGQGTIRRLRTGPGRCRMMGDEHRLG